MNLFALILALVALVLFLLDAIPRKAYIAWGLAALTLAWIAQNVLQSGSPVTVAG
jgi:hypothetical protein